MTLISSPQEFNEDELYVDLRSIFGRSLFLKCEGFNFAGSVKLKAATAMVEAAERDGSLRPGAFLVESSSGNLGVALSMIAASKGYRFLCVTDSRCNLATRQLMEALGATVHVVTEPDLVGGLLGARIDYIRALCAADDRFVWLNQYTNPNAWKAHYRTTAPAIAREFPNLDVLFVGAGTTGTLMGCARFFHERHPHVRVVAVDPVGSVSFGAPAARRMIPGLGMAVRPPLLDETYVDDVMHVEEPDAVRVCHRLAHRGFLFGGSTGTVVSGAVDWLAGHDADDVTAVALAPDLGERYLDTIYQANWVAGHLRRRRPAPGRAGLGHAGGGGDVRCPPRPDRPATVRAVPRRGAGRGGRCRTVSPRRPLLRRPGRGLHAHGPLLRPRPQAARPAVRVDEGRLPHPTIAGLARRCAPSAAPARSRPVRWPGRSPRYWPTSWASSEVPVGAHFFDDLGADSMVMARFCARVRKRPDLPTVSMKDVYRHPTIARLTDAFGGPAAAEPPVPPARAGCRRQGSRRGRPARAQYILCGSLQLLFFLGYSLRSSRSSSPGGPSGSRPGPVCSTCTNGRSWSAQRPSSVRASCRSWRSGCSSGGGGPAGSGSGASRTSASGSSRRWSGPTRCCWWPAAGPHQRELSLYLLYLRALGAQDRTERRDLLPEHAACAPTCSPSATAR